MAAREVVVVRGTDLKFAGLPPKASLPPAFAKDHPSLVHPGRMHFLLLQIQASSTPGVESNKRERWF